MRRTLWILAGAVAVAIGVAVVASSGTSARERPDRPIGGTSLRAAIPPGTALVTVGFAPDSRPIPSGFVGLSLEFPALQAYAGGESRLFERLVRDLTPGQSPVLKVGGDSTDWAWWPVPGLHRPPGIRYPLGQRFIVSARRLAAALDARLILGIDLEANSAAIADAEARAFIAGIGRRRIEALELGNEPELYPSWGWYRAADRREIPGRPRGYDFTAFTKNFRAIAATLPAVPLAGPAIGARGWMRRVAQFIAAEPRLTIVTLHRYPLQRCFLPAASPLYPTVRNLFSLQSSAGLAGSVARYVAIAHARGELVRIDELNSASCGGAPGLSNTFASALWALDTSFQMARVGVDGINIHMFPGASYELFAFRRARARWEAFVCPEYYGLLMFTEAAPPGSRLLRTSGLGPGLVRVWAVRAPGSTVRVVLINETDAWRAVAVRVPGDAGTGSLERLTAPGVHSTHGVTLGGQTFGPETPTATLAGTPRISRVRPVAGAYLVELPPTSAALLRPRPR